MGSGRDLDGLFERLETMDIRVPPDQRVRAHHVVSAYVADGGSLEDPRVLSQLLCPLIATTRDAQIAIRRAIETWSDNTPPLTSSLHKDLRESRGVRRILIILGVVALLSALSASIAFFEELQEFVTGQPSPGDVPEARTPAPQLPQTPEIVENPAPVVEPQPAPQPIPEPVVAPQPTTRPWTYLQQGSPPERVTTDILMRLGIPALFLLLPFVVLSRWILRAGEVRNRVLRREQGTGVHFRDLPVPEVSTGLFAGTRARVAARLMKAPLMVPSNRLDIARTLAETVRAGGAPALHWRRDARSQEYVVLVEQGGDIDHTALIANALTARLSEADVAFVRYDLDTGGHHARHVAGRRSGMRVERVEDLAKRYSGARLILVGHCGRLLRRFTRPGVENGAYGAVLKRVLEMFECPILLDLVPQMRWGGDEAAIAAQGVAVFPASDDGLRAAATHLLRADEDGALTATGRLTGTDPLLDMLALEGRVLTTNTPPPTDVVALLIRRLRGFVGGRDGFRLLAAIAAFPRIDPAITAYLADRLTGAPLSARHAGAFACLPWLQEGRMPDWLRLAILRQLPERDRADLRNTLMLSLEDFRRAAETGGGAAATEIDILTRPDMRHRLLNALGLGQASVSGEGIFLRFLDGAPLDDLDQPITPQATPLRTRPLVFAVMVMAIGLGLAATVPLWLNKMLVEMNGGFSRFPTLIQIEIFLLPLAPIYLWLQWRLINRRTAAMPVSRARRVADWGLHGFGLLLGLIVFGQTLVISLGNDPTPSILFVLTGSAMFLILIYHIRCDLFGVPRYYKPAEDLWRLGDGAGAILFVIIGGIPLLALGAIIDPQQINEGKTESLGLALIILLVMIVFVVVLLDTALRPRVRRPATAQVANPGEIIDRLGAVAIAFVPLMILTLLICVILPLLYYETFAEIGSSDLFEIVLPLWITPVSFLFFLFAFITDMRLLRSVVGFSVLCTLAIIGVEQGTSSASEALILAAWIPFAVLGFCFFVISGEHRARRRPEQPSAPDSQDLGRDTDPAKVRS